MAQDKPFPNLGGLTFSEDVFYRILDDLLGVGIVTATDYQVIQNHLGANMSVDVNPGSAYVAIANGGKRRTRLPAQSNSGTPGSPNAADNWLTTFTAADATNPRIDRVVLTVRDTSIDGSGASDSALRVIAGTPTSGATLVNLNGAAAVPANSILLANVLIPNAATTVITANIDTTVRPIARVAAGAASPVVTARNYTEVTKSVVQSILNVTLTAVTFDTETVDDANLHDNVTNNSRLTFATGGLFLVGAFTTWTANGTGGRVSQIKLNGATILAASDAPAANGGLSQGDNTIMVPHVFVANDYIELIGYQNSGGGINLNTATKLWAYRLA